MTDTPASPTASDSRAPDGPAPPSVMRRRWLRPLLVAVVGVLVVAAAATAATGGMSPGDVIPGGDSTGPPDNRIAVDQTVLATGVSAASVPWRMTSYGSEGVEHRGEVLEPKGTPCVEISLPQPPQNTPLLGSSVCGQEGAFLSGSLPVRDTAGAVELILFGTVPENADTVRLVEADGSTEMAQTFEGPDGFNGDLWALTITDAPTAGRVEWADKDGDVAEKTLDISGSLDRLKAFQNLKVE